jgi:hypothetical protein
MPRVPHASCARTKTSNIFCLAEETIAPRYFEQRSVRQQGNSQSNILLIQIPPHHALQKGWVHAKTLGLPLFWTHAVVLLGELSQSREQNLLGQKWSRIKGLNAPIEDTRCRFTNAGQTEGFV